MEIQEVREIISMKQNIGLFQLDISFVLANILPTSKDFTTYKNEITLSYILYSSEDGKNLDLM